MQTYEKKANYYVSLNIGPKKTVVFLAHIYNATFRLLYFPILWKHSIFILISIAQKPPRISLVVDQ